MSCGVGHRHSLALAWLWLWLWPAAVAPIRSLAWELACASGAALKRHTHTQIQGRGIYTMNPTQLARTRSPTHSSSSSSSHFIDTDIPLTLSGDVMVTILTIITLLGWRAGRAKETWNGVEHKSPEFKGTVYKVNVSDAGPWSLPPTIVFTISQKL